MMKCRIIHFINGVFWVLKSGSSGHTCGKVADCCWLLVHQLVEVIVGSSWDWWKIPPSKAYWWTTNPKLPRANRWWIHLVVTHKCNHRIALASQEMTEWLWSLQISMWILATPDMTMMIWMKSSPDFLTSCFRTIMCFPYICTAWVCISLRNETRALLETPTHLQEGPRRVKDRWLRKWIGSAKIISQIYGSPRKIGWIQSDPVKVSGAIVDPWIITGWWWLEHECYFPIYLE